MVANRPLRRRKKHNIVKTAKTGAHIEKKILGVGAHGRLQGDGRVDSPPPEK